MTISIVIENTTFSSALPVYFSPGNDPDMLAYIATAGITDPTEIDAVAALVFALKAAGIWDKFLGLYPISPTSLAAAAVNLKNPALNITWVGAVTHAATGVSSNAVTKYGDTGIVTSSLTYHSGHLAYYSRTHDTAPSGVREMGDQGNLFILGIQQSSAANTMYFRFAGLSKDAVANPSRTDGFFLMTRRADAAEIYRNGVTHLSLTTSTTNTTNAYSINLLKGSTAYSPRQCAFASVGLGMTDAQQLAYHNAVQAYQVALGRAV